MNVIKAPFMVAILIGLFFFLTGLPVPGILSKSIGFLANLNTPLAMFTIGIYLAQTDVKKMFFRKKLYLVSFVRLAAAPAPWAPMWRYMRSYMTRITPTRWKRW